MSIENVIDWSSSSSSFYSLWAKDPESAVSFFFVFFIIIIMIAFLKYYLKMNWPLLLYQRNVLKSIRILMYNIIIFSLLLQCFTFAHLVLTIGARLHWDFSLNNFSCWINAYSLISAVCLLMATNLSVFSNYWLPS